MSESTAKKTAAKKTAAAKPTEAKSEGTTTAVPEGAQPGATTAPAGSADSGPGTDASAPDESTARMPETVLTEDGLTPPSDAKEQSEPKEGYSTSSTDHTYAAAGGRTIAGEEFEGLYDEKGKKVSPGSVFDDGDGTKPFVTVKKRVYEKFYYPNTTEVASRLLFVEGQRVNRAEAARLLATVKG